MVFVSQAKAIISKIISITCRPELTPHGCMPTSQVGGYIHVSPDSCNICVQDFGVIWWNLINTVCDKKESYYYINYFTEDNRGLIENFVTWCNDTHLKLSYCCMSIRVHIHWQKQTNDVKQSDSAKYYDLTVKLTFDPVDIKCHHFFILSYYTFVFNFVTTTFKHQHLSSSSKSMFCCCFFLPNLTKVPQDAPVMAPKGWSVDICAKAGGVTSHGTKDGWMVIFVMCNPL